MHMADDVHGIRGRWSVTAVQEELYAPAWHVGVCGL